jgi:hypothetical protein
VVYDKHLLNEINHCFACTLEFKSCLVLWRFRSGQVRSLMAALRHPEIPTEFRYVDNLEDLGEGQDDWASDWRRVASLEKGGRSEHWLPQNSSSLAPPLRK